MSPIAATMPAATDRIAPVTAINRLTADCPGGRAGPRLPLKLADVPIDRRALIVWKLLSGHPHPAASVEQIGARALRDQVRVQDRIHLVLEPRAMPHDLVARDNKSGRSHHALAVPRSQGICRAHYVRFQTHTVETRHSAAQSFQRLAERRNVPLFVSLVKHDRARCRGTPIAEGPRGLLSLLAAEEHPN